MPEMQALKRFSYAGKALVAGAGFTASQQDARLLCAVKLARYATATPKATQESDEPSDTPDDDKPSKKAGRPRKAS